MEYLDLIQNAITYIEEHLETVRAMDVAQHIGYSYFHFTRLFSAVMGETVGSYIKKRRLAVAGKKLLYTDKRVIDIALESGFDSPEAFSRAFKTFFKVSPNLYRKNRLDVLAGRKKRLDHEGLRHQATVMNVVPEIVEMEQMMIAGIRTQEPPLSMINEQIFYRLLALRRQIPNQLENARVIVLTQADETIYEMDDSSRLSCVVGVEVNSFEGIPPQFCGATIPKGKFAVFTHRGDLHTISKTSEYIYGTWMPNTKERVRAKQEIDILDLRCIHLGQAWHPDNIEQICIPIA